MLKANFLSLACYKKVLKTRHSVVITCIAIDVFPCPCIDKLIDNFILPIYKTGLINNTLSPSTPCAAEKLNKHLNMYSLNHSNQTES